MRLRAALSWIACVAIAALAGWGCSRLGTPIPWMLGPLFSVALLRVAGVHITAPPGGRQVGQWVIGTALGLYFTPQVVREVAGWWPLLGLGAAFAIVLGYVGGLALARLAGIDRTTAIFASVPGGAAEMTVLGHRFGARADSVAAAQSMRVVIVVAVIPAVFFQLDLHGTDRYLPGMSAFEPAGFALLMAATAVGGSVAQWLRVPNAYVLGSLAVAIPLTAAEVNLSAVPTLASNCAQVLLGCALGARFHPNFRKGAPRFIGAVVASVLGAIVASALFAIAVGFVSGLNPATLVLAMAPGGIAEMCITAKGLQLGVPLVTAFQVVRIVVLLLVTGPLFARLRGWRREDAPPPDDF
jgi:membrane AbrB-like protein